LFNQNFIITVINKSQFYESTIDTIREDFISLAIPAGIPDTIIDDILDENVIYNNLLQNSEALFDKRFKEYDDDEMRSLISMKFREYAAEKGITGNKFEKELPELVEYFIKVYDKHVNIPFIKYYKSFRTVFYSMSMWIVPVTVIIIIMIILFLYNLYIHKKKILRYLYYSFGGAALMTLIPTIYSYNIELPQRIYISPKYVYDLISEVLYQGITFYFYSGLFLLIISLIVLASSIIAEYKMKHSYKR
jgi:hypothetical protein